MKVKFREGNTNAPRPHCAKEPGSCSKSWTPSAWPQVCSLLASFILQMGHQVQKKARTSSISTKNSFYSMSSKFWGHEDMPGEFYIITVWFTNKLRFLINAHNHCVQSPNLHVFFPNIIYSSIIPRQLTRFKCGKRWSLGKRGCQSRSLIN